jgi:hypothetical protein
MLTPSIQFNEGYPFNRGQWVGPTQAATTPVVPFVAPADQTGMPACVDSVQLSEATSARDMEGCVQVKDGDCLSKLLQERGYSFKEMSEKDENGLSLLDRTAAANGVTDPKMTIFAGQTLSLPSKLSEKTAGADSDESLFCDSGENVYDETDCANHEHFNGVDDFGVELGDFDDYDYDYDYADDSYEYAADGDYDYDYASDDASYDHADDGFDYDDADHEGAPSGDCGCAPGADADQPSGFSALVAAFSEVFGFESA